MCDIEKKIILIIFWNFFNNNVICSVFEIKKKNAINMKLKSVSGWHLLSH